VCLLDFYTTQILMSTTVSIEGISWLIKVPNNNAARWKMKLIIYLVRTREHRNWQL